MSNEGRIHSVPNTNDLAADLRWNTKILDPMTLIARKGFLAALLLASSCLAHARDNIINLYNWADYLPQNVIDQFEKETGIHVNYTSYDTNEMLYTKLKASPKSGYDLILPSTYTIDQMRREDMLIPLDKRKLPNLKNIDPVVLNQSYDPNNTYSIPYLISVTGIVYNDLAFPVGSVRRWTDLWAPRFKESLLFPDDVRDVSSIGLMVTDNHDNTKNLAQIKAAYQKLFELLPNIKLFNSEAPKSIYADEDAMAGVGWSGDIFLVNQENPHVHFVYPEDGFVISMDSFCIPKHAPHKENTYKFINFLLRPDIAAKISQETGYTSPNRFALKYLPEKIRNSPIMYPGSEVLARGHYQLFIGETAKTYVDYFQQLKLNADY